MNELTPAWVLHTRDYRDTSLLVELLTPDAGRVGAIARGARRLRRGVSQRALLQPLRPLWVATGGSGELKALRSAELRPPMPALHGHALFSALYVNELLMRLLHRDDPHPQLFDDYARTLAALAQAADRETVLRRFELALLEALGYGFSLVTEGISGAALQPERHYRFDPEAGLVRAEGAATDALVGRDLLDFAAGEVTDSVRRSMKALCRQALQPHLGQRPLLSRQLFTGR